MSRGIGSRGGAGAYIKHRKPSEHICENCGNTFYTSRSHAKTCKTRCRVALHRKTKKQNELGLSTDSRVIVINTKAGRIEQRVMWS